MDILNTFVPYTEKWKEETFFWIQINVSLPWKTRLSQFVKITGFKVGNLFFFQLTTFIVFGLHITNWKSFSHIQLFETPWTIQSMEFSRPETGTGSLSLLQGLFPTQGLNPGLPPCMWILYQEGFKQLLCAFDILQTRTIGTCFYPAPQMLPGSQRKQNCSICLLCHSKISKPSTRIRCNLHLQYL